MQKWVIQCKKEVKTEHSDWLINEGTHREPIRLEQLTGQTTTKQYGGRSGKVWREQKHIDSCKV